MRICIESCMFQMKENKAEIKSTFVLPGEPIRATGSGRDVAGVGCEAAGRTRVLSVRCCSPARCLMFALLSEAPLYKNIPAFVALLPLASVTDAHDGSRY